MKKNLLTLGLALAAGLSFTACNKTPEFVLAEKGPDMFIQSCSEAAEMGSDIKFAVKVIDTDYDLSTLKVKLFFDETEVNALTIRTKENGVYEGTIQVPLLKDVPNGTAQIAFVSQNVGQAITADTLDVAVSRPNPETVTLVGKDNKEYTMKHTADYKYELTANLPKKFSVLAHVPTKDGEPIVLGWADEKLTVGADYIPFSVSHDAEYTVSLDLMSLSAAPFDGTVTVVSELSEGAPVEYLDLKQGIGIQFKNIPDVKDWNLDRDFFKVNAEGIVVFNAVDGRYSFKADFKNAFIRVEPVDAENQPLTLKENGEGALWMIGGGFGKPSVGPSWNTTEGAYACAQLTPKVYQITFNVGSQLAEGFSLKFFHQKGWGGEFKSYAKVNDNTGVFVVKDSGNIEIASGKSAAEGRAYSFSVDLTAGIASPVLTIREVEAKGGKALDIFVNGVKADKISNTIYKVKAVKMTKGQEITFEGIDTPEKWWVDPDHYAIEGGKLKFNAIDGFYSIELNLDEKFVTTRRVKENGKNATFKEDGVVVLMGWGIGHPYNAKQIAWDNGALLTLAEIEPNKFQFTGRFASVDSKTMGDRFGLNVNDGISFKLFGQSGWGDEMGTDYTIGAEAAALGFVNAGNIECGPSKKHSDRVCGLKEGVTYVMTFTFKDKTLNGNKFTMAFDCHEVK